MSEFAQLTNAARTSFLLVRSASCALQHPALLYNRPLERGLSLAVRRLRPSCPSAFLPVGQLRATCGRRLVCPRALLRIVGVGSHSGFVKDRWAEDRPVLPAPRRLGNPACQTGQVRRLENLFSGSFEFWSWRCRPISNRRGAHLLACPFAKRHPAPLPGVSDAEASHGAGTQRHVSISFGFFRERKNTGKRDPKKSPLSRKLQAAQRALGRAGQPAIIPPAASRHHPVGCLPYDDRCNSNAIANTKTAAAVS